MNHQIQPPTNGEHQVNIPAVRLALTGLKAEFHLIRHSAKQQKCPLDAGMDLFPSEIDKVTYHGPVAMIWVHTMVTAHIGPGCKGIIEARSSSDDRLNGGECVRGIIDAGYSGELIIRVRVPNSKAYIDSVSESIRECQRNQVAIAQLMIEQCLAIYPVIPPVIPPALGGRGTGGFGSTDKLHK